MNATQQASQVVARAPVAEVNGVASDCFPRSLFFYNSYWATWSRVLRWYIPSSMGRNAVTQVEVDLTAVNPQAGSWNWDRVRRINIRSHSTARSPKDIVLIGLPHEVIAQMREHLDEDLINRLLHEDFLPQIDWSRYHGSCNGGAAFKDIVYR